MMQQVEDLPVFADDMTMQPLSTRQARMGKQILEDLIGAASSRAYAMRMRLKHLSLPGDAKPQVIGPGQATAERVAFAAPGTAVALSEQHVEILRAAVRRRREGLGDVGLQRDTSNISH